MSHIGRCAELDYLSVYLVRDLSELLLVTLQNDNHSPGPGRLVLSSHQRSEPINTILGTFKNLILIYFLSKVNCSVGRAAVLYYWATYLFCTGSSPARDKIFIWKKIRLNVCGLAVSFRSRWFHRHILGMPRYILAFLHLRQPST